jgi:hypothetical protein
MSEVLCGENYINGRKYNDITNNTTITPCISKNLDFNTTCQFYNNKPIPHGYNVNSIGAKYILKGQEGDCYLNDGTPDTNKARAICDYDNIYTIPKLERAFNELDYNKFTPCLPINSNNFLNSCATIMNRNTDNVLVDQIMGYDCNPGYGRGKCLKNTDKELIDNNLNNLSSYYQPSSINNSNNNSCNC